MTAATPTLRPIGPAEIVWAQDFCRLASALSPETIAQFSMLYAPDALFSDPFHRLQGRAAIADAYRSMFRSLVSPGFFELSVAWVHSDKLAVGWVFRFRLSSNGPTTEIPGTSWLWLDPDSRHIVRHEDHWDASAFFGAFTGLRKAVGWLKSRVAHAGSVTQKT